MYFHIVQKDIVSIMNPIFLDLGGAKSVTHPASYKLFSILCLLMRSLHDCSSGPILPNLITASSEFCIDHETTCWLGSFSQQWGLRFWVVNIRTAILSLSKLPRSWFFATRMLMF